MFFIALLVLIIIIMLPTKNKEASFKIEDRCGPIANMISHTIANEDSCKAQCRVYCEVKEKEFSKVDFAENAAGCNNCTCFCKS